MEKFQRAAAHNIMIPGFVPAMEPDASSQRGDREALSWVYPISYVADGGFRWRRRRNAISALIRRRCF